jgi:DNA-binding response OmpR family regulator
MSKIFIVEDNVAIREVLELFLIMENYNVKSFGSVQEFISRDIKDKPDLYLFDVMLPDGSGIDLCHEIKKDTLQNNVPVIIMSAHAKLSHMKDICQPDDLIAKPFDLDDIVKRIKSVLNE